MTNELLAKPPEHQADSKKKLVRDVLLFQGKLAMDGVRDLILSPVSIAVAIYGVIARPDNPAEYFQTLMRFGRKTDDFINLFGHKNDATDRQNHPISDDYADKIEAALAKQLEKENAFYRRKTNVTTRRPDKKSE